MQTHIGKAIRLSDILDNNSLMLDTTIGSSIGATPQLEDLKSVLQTCSNIFNGIVVNPGQMEHLSFELAGKNRAAPLVRVDWTNAYRDADFCLPVSEVQRIEISQADDLLNLGASAAVATMLMGFGDDFEAENISSISKLIRESYDLSLPVFVDIRPIGPKVSQVNFEDTIKLGVSFMMEAGADALIIPYCSLDTLKIISDWSTIPVIVRTETLFNKNESKAIFDLGIKGILFSEKILEVEEFYDKIKNMEVV